MRNVVHGNEAPPPPAAAAAAVPPRLASAQVRGVMTPLAGAVRACTQGATGQALVALTLVSDGTVQNASVSGPFTPTVRTCIEGVVRRAHFPRFSSPTQQVAYPFTIAAGG